MKPETKEAIDRYVSRKIPTGDFLYAVLCNDLRNAIGRADSENLRDIVEIVQYCHWEIPSVCWGSPEEVRAWLAPPMEPEDIIRREA